MVVGGDELPPSAKQYSGMIRTEEDGPQERLSPARNAAALPSACGRKRSLWRLDLVPAAGGPGPAGGRPLPGSTSRCGSSPRSSGSSRPSSAGSASAPQPLLEIEPAPRPVADVEAVVDRGRDSRPGSRPHVAASSRSYRFSANVQVVIDADTRLVIASARPFARMKNWKVLRDRRRGRSRRAVGAGSAPADPRRLPHQLRWTARH